MAHGHGHAHGHAHDHSQGHPQGRAHGHAHGHRRRTDDAARRALWWALALNGAFLAIEATAGFLSGSLALLSDAAHMVNDVAALSLALGVAWLARRPPSPRTTFGYRRAEVLGAMASGLALLVACVVIFVEAIERLHAGAPDVPGWPILWVGLVGLGINLGSAWHLHRSGSASLNVRGAMLHMLMDAAGSAGAVLAALLVMAGMPSADPVVSLLTGALVLWAGVGLVRDAGRVLLESAPAHLDPREIRERLLAVEEVRDVHDLHVWSLDGETVLLSAHVVVDEPDGGEPQRLAALLRDQLAIDHSTLQIERGTGCGAPPCPIHHGQ
ncbi:MAG: cation transporter [Myxococcales bacterium]|nr:cation transporter [Myxococcales bacterium]